MLTNLRKKIAALPTGALFLPLFLAGLLLGLAAALFKPYDGTPAANFIVAVIFGLWGAAGWVMFTRREMLQAGMRIRGKLPRFYGFLTMAFCWGMALFALVKMVEGLVN